jgi:hypothetical protein
VFEEHRVDGAALLRVLEEDLHRVLRVSTLGDLKHVRKTCLLSHSLAPRFPALYLNLFVLEIFPSDWPSFVTTLSLRSVQFLLQLSLAIDRLRVVPVADPEQADPEPWLDSAAKLLFR